MSFFLSQIAQQKIMILEVFEANFFFKKTILSSLKKKFYQRNQQKLQAVPPACSSSKNKCCRQIADCKQFKSDQTGEIYEIRHKLNCKSKNVIYLGYCLKCAHNQYVGKSEPPAHLRFNTHRHDVTSETGLAFDRHFSILMEDVKEMWAERPRTR